MSELVLSDCQRDVGSNDVHSLRIDTPYNIYFPHAPHDSALADSKRYCYIKEGKIFYIMIPSRPLTVSSSVKFLVTSTVLKGSEESAQ